MKSNIDELLIPVLVQVVSNRRFVVPILGQRQLHLLQRLVHLRLGETRSGVQTARTLQLRVERRAVGSNGRDNADKHPWIAAEYQSDSIPLALSINLDRIKQPR